MRLRRPSWRRLRRHARSRPPTADRAPAEIAERILVSNWWSLSCRAAPAAATALHGDRQFTLRSIASIPLRAPGKDRQEWREVRSALPPCRRHRDRLLYSKAQPPGSTSAVSPTSRSRDLAVEHPLHGLPRLQPIFSAKASASRRRAASGSYPIRANWFEWMSSPTSTRQRGIVEVTGTFRHHGMAMAVAFDMQRHEGLRDPGRLDAPSRRPNPDAVSSIRARGLIAARRIMPPVDAFAALPCKRCRTLSAPRKNESCVLPPPFAHGQIVSKASRPSETARRDDCRGSGMARPTRRGPRSASCAARAHCAKL